MEIWQESSPITERDRFYKIQKAKTFQQLVKTYISQDYQQDSLGNNKST